MQQHQWTICCILRQRNDQTAQVRQVNIYLTVGIPYSDRLITNGSLLPYTNYLAGIGLRRFRVQVKEMAIGSWHVLLPLSIWDPPLLPLSPTIILPDPFPEHWGNPRCTHPHHVICTSTAIVAYAGPLATCISGCAAPNNSELHQ